MPQLTSIDVLEWKAKSVEKKLTAMQRRAAKLGLPPITFYTSSPGDTDYYIMFDRETGETWSSPDPKSKTSSEFTGRVVRTVRFIVSGDHPHFNGWRLVAKLSPTADCQYNIIKMVPGVTSVIPSHYLRSVGVCEHCHTVRRRKETFIVEKVDGDDIGTFKAVGRSCIQDFLGGASPEQILLWGTFVFSLDPQDEVDDVIGGLPHVRPTYCIRKFIATTRKVIDRDGFVSKSKAYDEQRLSTADIVEDCLSGCRIPGNTRIELEDSDYAVADECIGWMASLPLDTRDSIWNQNLRTLSIQEYVTDSDSGIVCAAVNQHKNVVIRSSIPEVESEYVGEENQRITIKAKLVGIIPIESYYGNKYLHRFCTPEGNELVWFCSGRPMEMEAVGSSFEIVGTVTRHTSYRNKKQTTLSRVKWFACSVPVAF